jgi:hypothetical protein
MRLSAQISAQVVPEAARRRLVSPIVLWNSPPPGSTLASLGRIAVPLPLATHQAPGGRVFHGGRATAAAGRRTAGLCGWWTYARWSTWTACPQGTFRAANADQWACYRHF